jgi:hypothetical protein
MTNLEQEVERLLRELADATPVTRPDARPGSAGRRPEYPLQRDAPRRAHHRRRAVVVAAATAALLVLVAGLLTVQRDGTTSVVVAERAALAVDTTALGAARLAVVVENDLYVADGPSGRVWRLTRTRGGEEVSQVSFSHDGEWVAFSIHDESGLWVSRWDGSERHRLGRSPRSYAWSPAAAELAYVTQDEVRVASVDGSSRVLQGGPAPMPFTPVVWSPDGKALAFVQSTGGGSLGGTARAVLRGRDDAGWGPVSTTPAAAVLAWPRPDLLLVDRLGSASEPLNVAAMSWDDGAITPLADVALVSSGYLLAVGEDRLVGVAGDPNRVATCTLAQPSCEALLLPFAPLGYSEPALAPTERAVALVGGIDSATGAYQLLVADLTGTGSVSDLGPIDSEGRGRVVVDGKGYGVTPEAPQWIDETSLLVRVDEHRLERVDAMSGERTIVVVGNRFRPTDDGYPGGSGLAVWRPAG